MPTGGTDDTTHEPSRFERIQSSPLLGIPRGYHVNAITVYGDILLAATDYGLYYMPLNNRIAGFSPLPFTDEPLESLCPDPTLI